MSNRSGVEIPLLPRSPPPSRVRPHFLYLPTYPLSGWSSPFCRSFQVTKGIPCAHLHLCASHFEQRGGLCPHPHHSLGVYQSYFWAETPTYVKYVKSRPGNESFIQDELVTSTILLNSNDLHVYPLLLSLFLFRTDSISRNASFDSLLQICF